MVFVIEDRRATRTPTHCVEKVPAVDGGSPLPEAWVFSDVNLKPREGDRKA